MKKDRGRSQAVEAVFHDIILCPAGQNIDCTVFGDGARNEDKGNVPVVLSQELQRLHPRPFAQRVSGDDDVTGLRAQLGAKLPRVSCDLRENCEV